jgi:hypothetical protein
MLMAISMYMEKLIKGGAQYLIEKFTATEISFSLAASMFGAFTCTSITEGSQEFGNSKTKFSVTPFKKMLVGGGKDEKMLIYVIGIHAIEQKCPLLVVLHDVVSMRQASSLHSIVA